MENLKNGCRNRIATAIVMPVNYLSFQFDDSLKHQTSAI